MAKSADASGKGKRFVRWILTAGLFYVGLLKLLTSSSVLCMPGCMVGYYLWAGAFCVPALGWARKPFIKVCAAILILISMRMALTDHFAGRERHDRILRVKYMAEGRAEAEAKAIASTQPSTAPTSNPSMRDHP